MNHTKNLRQKLNDLKQNRWSTIALALILLWFIIAVAPWLIWNHLLIQIANVRPLTIGQISVLIAAIAFVDCLLFGAKRK